jgi:hypothetical protein
MWKLIPEQTRSLKLGLRAYHYYARILEIERHPTAALELYLRGQHIQRLLPEDTNALGYCELRIAELLAGCRLPNSARDHLAAARTIFSTASNQASGYLQSDLAEASIDAARGKYRKAEAIVADALERSRQIGFPRGELLSLGYLLALRLRGRRFKDCMRTAIAVVRTLQQGELHRTNMLRLIRHVPTAFRFARYRMGAGIRGRTKEDQPKSCPCRIHSNTFAGADALSI